MRNDRHDEESRLLAAKIIQEDARSTGMDHFARADAYAYLKACIETERGQCSNNDLACYLGVTKQRVSEVLKLLELPATLREQVRGLGLGHRSTVDLVRDLIKAENPEKMLEEVSAQKIELSYDSDSTTTKRKVRRKTIKLEQNGYEVIIKASSTEKLSNDKVIEKLEKIIQKLKKSPTT